MEKMRIVEANMENVEKYAICGYNNPKKNPGYLKKIEWMKTHFKNGLRYKLLVTAEDKAIGGIEYIPGEYAFKPVNAKGFMFINCIYIMKKEIKGKGYGNKLLQESINDAKNSNMNGVSIITRKGSWMPSDKLFIKNGFEIVDRYKPDFQLLVKKFNKNTENPNFIDNSDCLDNQYKNGIFIFVSDQCPYLAKCVPEMVDLAKDTYSINPKIIEIKTSIDAQKTPSPFGTFCVVVNGKVVTENPISKTRLNNILKKELTES